MDLNYIADYNEATLKKMSDLGFDESAILFVCQDLLSLQSDLQLESGDLRDFIYRLRNRYDHLQGSNPEMKLKCEDISPARITYQPNGSRQMFFFQRCLGQNFVPYRECIFFCELCGNAAKLKKKEIKTHIAYAHRLN